MGNCAPVNLQSESFQLRSLGGDEPPSQRTIALEGVFEKAMPPTWGRPINNNNNTGNRTRYGATASPTTLIVTRPAPRPSVTTATIISITGYPFPTSVDPQTTTTSSPSPSPTESTVIEEDKRDPKGISKAAVIGIGVGVSVGALLVSLVLFFCVRRRFLRWHWDRKVRQSREIRPRPGSNVPRLGMEHLRTEGAHWNPSSSGLRGSSEAGPEESAPEPAEERPELERVERRDWAVERTEGRAKPGPQETSYVSIIPGRAELP